MGEVDGRPVAATGAYDGTALLWDARTGEPIQRLKVHGGWPGCLALGQVRGQPVVVTGSVSYDDGTTQLWDARTGEQLLILGVDGEIGGVAIGELDGLPVVAAGSKQRTVHIWEASTGKELVNFAVGGRVNDLALDAGRLAVACDLGIVIIEHHDTYRHSRQEIARQ
jgi:WD40 repeat protein